MNLLSPSEIASIAVTELSASEWDGGSAFGSVERFDSVQIESAIRTLVLSGNRVAIVIPTSSRFEDLVRDEELAPIVRRTTSLIVLVSDRVAGHPDDAMFGSGSNPGCIGLSEIAILALTGVHSSGLRSCRMVPVSDEPFAANVDGGTQRKAVQIEFAVEQDWDTKAG